MLSEPKYGWVDIKIGNWCGSASYLTNPHLDLLDAFCEVLSKRNVSSVFCDGEGWEFVIVLTDFYVYVIESKEENKLFSFEDKTLNELAKELIQDILANIDLWCCWDYNNESEDSCIKARKEILKKVRKLEKLVNYYKERLRVLS